MRLIHKTSSGFTLMEVVIALAIVSISLTVLYQILTSVARGTRLSSDYYTAIRIAETQLALLSANSSDASKTSGTEMGQFEWESVVSNYAQPANSPLVAPNGISDSDATAFSPVLLSVTVSWGDNSERTLELSTIKLERQL